MTSTRIQYKKNLVHGKKPRNSQLRKSVTLQQLHLPTQDSASFMCDSPEESVGCFISTKTFTPVPQRSHCLRGQRRREVESLLLTDMYNTDTRSRATQIHSNLPSHTKGGCGDWGGFISNVTLQLFQENPTFKSICITVPSRNTKMQVKRRHSLTPHH